MEKMWFSNFLCNLKIPQKVKNTRIPFDLKSTQAVSRKREPTFPLVVRKELEVGIVARVWLAWRQTAPVPLTGVGILITFA